MRSAVEDEESEEAPQEKQSWLQFSRIDPEALVDLRLSNSRAVDEELLRRGYAQLLPDVKTAGYSVAADSGTFGRGQNLWIWRKRQGTMDGRLRPVVDLQLNALSPSSAMVLAGYTCLSVQVGGQWLWIRRAQNEEEEADAIVDLVVTIGHQRNPSDKIWTSPGVGWIRVDGNFGKGMLSSYDAFLWFRPHRARTGEASNVSPVRSIVGLKEEMRLSVLLDRVKLCLRHAVPLDRMVASTNEDSGNLRQSGAQPTRQEEKSGEPAASTFDFSYYYHKFDAAGSGKLGFSKFETLLADVGLRLERKDVRVLFHAFNVNLDGYLSRQEFWMLLNLTELELDERLEVIRSRLIGIAGGSGASRLRINSRLREIFRIINQNRDGILSLSDTLLLCGRMGIYLCEDEARRLMRLIDRDADDRIEEGDFVSSIARGGDLRTRRAQRLRDAASALRVWLNRNNKVGLGASLNAAMFAAAVQHQWLELKTMHEKSYGGRFSGFLTPDDLHLLLLTMGVHLSPVEVRELALVMAPDRAGRLQQPDLVSFMSSSCRSFGELCAILERDLMKPLFDCYRSYRSAVQADGDYLEWQDEYADMCKVLATAVEAARGDSAGTRDVVAVTQVKNGVETVMRGYTTPADQLPGLEEWVCLGALAGALVAEGETYGMRLQDLVDGLCCYIVGPLRSSGKTDKATIAQVTSELRSMIRHEAELAGRGRTRDYKSVFALFDVDGSGALDLREFRNMLARLQLIDNLAEADIPALLQQFDASGKGKVTMEDLRRFIEARVTDSDSNSVDEEDERNIGLLSNKPPATISMNEDCDWLVWFLWKQCCNVSPREPESVVTDLEVACAESSLVDSNGFIESEELWQIIGELGLRGHMTKAQFSAGTNHLLEKPSKDKHEHALVDYEALCRNIIRMGRAFNDEEQRRRKVDEARYQDLKREFLSSMLEERSSDSTPADPRKKSTFRFERVFKRMDSNDDGFITIEEFRNGLRELKLKASKQWTQQMAWRLFEDIDSNSDGKLSLLELSSYVRANGQPASKPKVLSSKEMERDEGSESDDIFVHGGDAISDEKLFRKVSLALQESVPLSDKQLKDEHSRSEAIKSAIRKFFKRGDESGRGLTTEARYKVFCRQSGLSSRLSVSEMKQLLKKLVRRGGREGGESFVDYERLCARISVVEESSPHVKGQAVMLRLQDAALDSEADGRPFLALCSLCDRELTGRMTERDLIHTAKIMGCDLSTEDLLAIRDLFPQCFTMAKGEVLYDYPELGRVLESFAPDVFVKPFDAGRSLGSSFRSLSSTMKHTTPFASQRTLGSSLRTPGGYFISTPLPSQSSNQAYELVLNAVAEKVNRAVLEQSRSKGFSFSLERQFSAYDRAGRGVVTVRIFQNALEDIGVSLSPTDLLAIVNNFGADSSQGVRRGDEALDYLAFCRYCSSITDKNDTTIRPRSQTKRRESMPAFLTSSRVARRVLQLQQDGNNPRDIFEAEDLDASGLIAVPRFERIVRNLGLLMTENQLEQCIESFASLSDRYVLRMVFRASALTMFVRGMIAYEDFCEVLERAASEQQDVREGLSPPPRRPLSRTWGSTDDFSFSRGATERQSRSFNSERKPPRPLLREPSRDFDDEDDEVLLPPKRLDSTSENPRYAESPRESRNSALGFSMRSSSPLSTTRSLETPRSPPRRVGASMWGSETPLGKKGLPPKSGDGKWCCAVCYYTENSPDSTVCEVCTSPNHHANKDFAVKIQCSNCTFLNGQFALVCEMCGRNLAKK